MLVKYPKTPYLNISPSIDKDDAVVDLAMFEGKDLVISTKMDGSNTSFTKDSCEARSGHHPSFNRIKALHGQTKHLIPNNIQIFGESLFAKHSIHYTGSLALNSFFQVFAAFDMQNNQFLSVADTVKLTQDIWLNTVNFASANIDTIQSAFDKVIEAGHEGIVIRLAQEIPLESFYVSMAKMVRLHHVQSQTHWTKQIYTHNEIT